MTQEQICDLYDSKPDMTLGQLSKLTGLTIAQLKLILMKG